MKENDITDGENKPHLDLEQYTKPQLDLIDLILASYEEGLNYACGIKDSLNVVDYIKTIDIKQFIK